MPSQSATLSDAGTYSTCAGPTCVANPGLGEIELPYGQQISLGPFLCTSSTGGMTCTANGKGFEISGQVWPLPRSTTSDRDAPVFDPSTRTIDLAFRVALDDG